MFQTPNAKNGLLGRTEIGMLVSMTSMKFDDKTREYTIDDKVDIVYEHQLTRCQTTLDASDREASIQSGFAIDKNGEALNHGHVRCGKPANVLVMQRPFLPIGVEANASNPIFRNQLDEIMWTIQGLHEVQLPTHWHGLNGESHPCPSVLTASGTL